MSEKDLQNSIEDLSIVGSCCSSYLKLEDCLKRIENLEQSIQENNFNKIQLKTSEEKEEKLLNQAKSNNFEEKYEFFEKEIEEINKKLKISEQKQDQDYEIIKCLKTEINELKHNNNQKIYLHEYVKLSNEFDKINKELIKYKEENENLIKGLDKNVIQFNKFLKIIDQNEQEKLKFKKEIEELKKANENLINKNNKLTKDLEENNSNILKFKESEYEKYIQLLKILENSEKLRKQLEIEKKENEEKFKKEIEKLKIKLEQADLEKSLISTFKIGNDPVKLDKNCITYKALYENIKIENEKMKKDIEILQTKNQKVVQSNNNNITPIEKLEKMKKEMKELEEQIEKTAILVILPNKISEIDDDHTCCYYKRSDWICNKGCGYIKINDGNYVKYYSSEKGSNRTYFLSTQHQFTKSSCYSNYYSLFYFEIKMIESLDTCYFTCGIDNSDEPFCLSLHNKKTSNNEKMFIDGDIFGCGVIFPPFYSQNEKFPLIFFTKNGNKIGEDVLLKNNYDCFRPAIDVQCCSVEINFGNDLKEKPFVFDCSNIIYEY